MALTRKLLSGTALLASLAGCSVENHDPKKDISTNPENYSWLIFYGQEGDIKESYMREDINHNPFTWKRYQELLRKRNDYLNATGENMIDIPDLDRDGRVFFGGRFFSLADTVKAQQNLPRNADVPEELK